MKTEDQIKTEIETLRRFAPTIPQRSLFGDDNRAQIDAQIEALEDEMDDDNIDDKEIDEEWDSNAAEAAHIAITWRDHDGESPSSGWEALVN